MKSFLQFLSESENIENYSIDFLKTKRGTIGTQGVTDQGLKNILSEYGEMKFDTNADVTKILQQFKNDKLAQEKIISYVNKNPIELIEFPGGEGAAIKDGNHRAFLMNEIGQKTVPATVKRSNIPNSQTTPKPPTTPKSSRLPGLLGAGLAALSLASGAKAEDIATGFLDPISTPFDRPAGLGSDQLDTDIDKYYDKQGRPKRSAWPADATDVQGKPITNWSPEK